MQFSGTDFNLGTVKYGEFITSIANVSNLYNVPVTLDPANSSCSCTTGIVKNAKLMPNGKTQFTITLSTGKAGKGMNQVKSISLNYSFNGVKHSQVFRLRVNII